MQESRLWKSVFGYENVSNTEFETAMKEAYMDKINERSNVTIQLTSDLPDSGVKSAHLHLYTARFFLVLEQIRGNLNSYELSGWQAE